MNGIERVSQAFAGARAEGRAALMPYFTLGYPNPPTSLQILEAIAGAGADILELGIPYSDPLADGPTIQRSTQIALEQGMTVAGCLEMVASLRALGAEQPLFLMSYINPILAYGMEPFVDDACATGADGLIIPDLPPEEAGELEAICRARGCALVYLLAPTTPGPRLVQIASRTTGFLYLVSLNGVTGARAELHAHLEAFIQRVRPAARVPLAVGFGISTPTQARLVGRLADGVIVGSALIQAVMQSANPAETAASFVHGMREALKIIPSIS